MTNEFHACRKSFCLVPKLLQKGFVAIWPQMMPLEGKNGEYVWYLYIKWTKTKGTKVWKASLCEKHHKQILAMFEDEMKQELREMEVTEEWLVRVNSRMLS